MKTISAVSVLVLVFAGAGCSDSPEDCVDTYRSGSNGDSYETTCDTPVSPPGSATSELEPGDCLETYETRCPPGQECQELYSRRCEDATANVAPTEVGQLEQSLLISDCVIDNNEHTVTALRPVFDPFLTALRTINQEFSADQADPNFFLRTITSRGQQGSLDVRAIGILGFSDRGDDIMGTTSCIRDGGSGIRGRCEIVVYRDAIVQATNETGLDPFEVEYVTAMHEFGHTFCLQHMTDSSGLNITAMNSFHNRDTSRSQLNYLTYLGSEREDVRSIILNP